MASTDIPSYISPLDEKAMKQHRNPEMKRTRKKSRKTGGADGLEHAKAAKAAAVSASPPKRLPAKRRRASNRRMSELIQSPEVSAEAAELLRSVQGHLLAALQGLQSLQHHPAEPGSSITHSMHLVQLGLALLSEGDGSREPLGLAPQRLAEFAAILRQRRKSAGLSQEQLARLANLSERTISSLESARQAPSSKTLCCLMSVTSLRMKVSDFSSDITSDPAWLPNSWMAPRYNPSQLMADMVHLLNSPGGQLEQTYLYLEPQSANDFMQLCNSNAVFVGFRMHAPLEQIAGQVAKRCTGMGIDITALGSGDGQGEVRLVQALASSRGANPDLRLYLLDISHTLLNIAHKHARATLAPGSVEIYALHANFHDISRYPVLHAASSTHRRRLYLLLGNTIANLDNEIRFFQDLASCTATDDLCVLDIQIAAAPAERPADIQRLETPLSHDYHPPHEDWLLGPLERHCQGMLTANLHVELTVHCPVPGSYELNNVCRVKMRDGSEKRFMLWRVKRYDPARLTSCLDGLGWECLTLLKYGVGAQKTAAVMLLRRK